MKAYLTDLYQGVVVRHSFRTDSSTVDCIERDTQPSLRKSGEKIRMNPPRMLPPVPAGANLATQDLYSTTPDVDGNVRQCPSGTIPMRRITIDELSRFPTLDAWEGKGNLPNSLRSGPCVPGSCPHEYATSRDIVENVSYGIQSTINIWNTYVAGGVTGNQFTLSQIWAAKDPAFGIPTQTAEAGVIKHPWKFNSHSPVLFVFATANGYGGNGLDCWNLQCGFTQVDSSILLGGTYAPSVSQLGGTQIEATFTLEMNDTNDWWFGYQGHWVGYYSYHFYADPYGYDPFTFATRVLGGGEVQPPQEPPHTETGMGSYVLAVSSPSLWSTNFTLAAYQSHVITFDANYYYPNPNVASSPRVDNANCYNYFGANGDPSHGSYFFFGGPGLSVPCP